MNTTYEVCVRHNAIGSFCGWSIGQYNPEKKKENQVRIISLEVSRFENIRTIARVIESAMAQVVEAIESVAERQGKTEALETLYCIINCNQKNGDPVDKKTRFAAIWFEVAPHHRLALFHALVRRIFKSKSGWSEYLPPTSHVYIYDIDSEESGDDRCQSKIPCVKKAKKKITCGTVSQVSCNECRHKVAEMVVDIWSGIKRDAEQCARARRAVLMPFC